MAKKKSVKESELELKKQKEIAKLEKKLESIEQRLEELAEERNQAQIVLNEAIAQGDASENSDRDAAMEKSGRLDAEYNELVAQKDDIENKLSHPDTIVIEDVDDDVVHIDSIVDLLELDTNEKNRYMIVDSYNADETDKHDIFMLVKDSELAKALIGHKVGDVVTVRVEKPYDVKINKITVE